MFFGGKEPNSNGCNEVIEIPNFSRKKANKRKFNTIRTTKVNAQVHGQESSTKNAIVHLNENLLHDDHPQRPLLNGILRTPSVWKMPFI